MASVCMWVQKFVAAFGWGAYEIKTLCQSFWRLTLKENQEEKLRGLTKSRGKAKTLTKL